MAGRKQIPVEIRDGELRDAIRYALSANSSHGLRRSNADKRNAVLVALADPEWAQLSDRQIADLCGVSQPFVGRIRKELSESIDNGYQCSDTIICKDGREYPRNRQQPDAEQTPEHTGSDAPSARESRIIRPLTSEQLTELNILFKWLSEDETDSWLGPYGVDDWGDLNQQQAAELIQMMRRDPDIPPEVETADDDADELAVTEHDMAEVKTVEVTLKGTTEDKWTSATIILRGSLAWKWETIQHTLLQRAAALRQLDSAIDAACKLRRVNSPVIFERKNTSSGERWECKPLRTLVSQLKQYDPVCPCPRCMDEPVGKCAICDGTQWVSKEAWDLGWLRPDEKLSLIETLGGSVQ